MSLDKIEQKDVQQLLHVMLDKANWPHIKKITESSEFPQNISFRSFLGGIRNLEARKNGRIRVGGGGVVIECWHQERKCKYALKLSRPSLLSKSTSKISQAELDRRESLMGASLSHANVVYLVDMDRLELPGTKYANAQLGEWVEKARDLAEYIYTECHTPAHFVAILRQVLSGIEHVHSKGLIHWDIKAANCLVSDDGVVKITDVGNARKLREIGVANKSNQIAYTSRENAPRAFAKDKKEGSDSRRIEVPIIKGKPGYDRPWLDFYMFGRMIGRILGFEPEKKAKEQRLQEQFVSQFFSANHEDTVMVKQFLKVIVERLTIPIDREFADEKLYYYSNAREIILDLQKLSRQFGDAQDVKELYPFSRRVVRIPVTRNTEYSSRIKTLIDSAPVKRLKKHRQLALTYHIYPGVRHVRHEHILGVISKALDYVRTLYADQCSAHFRLLMDSIHVRALIFAAAVHDVGHGAFGHYLEEWKTAFACCKHEAYAQAILRNDRTQYGVCISDNCFTMDRNALLKCAEEWVKDLRDAYSADDFLNLVADILASPKEMPSTRELSLLSRSDSALVCHSILHSIIDSTIDADKLDYLKRDAHHAGLDYAWALDNDRFFQALTTVCSLPPKMRSDPQNKYFHPTIAITTKGVEPVECLMVARYQLFRAMYWHKKARAATVVLLHLVYKYFHLKSLQGRKQLDKALSGLLSKFRESDDDTSIIWLKKEILNLIEGARNKDKRQNIESLSTAILEREGLPVRIFETNQSIIGSRRKKYARLLELHSQMHKENPYEYCRFWDKILRDLAVFLISLELR